MREKPRCFIVNKESDFDRGFGGITSGEGLSVSSFFFSELFDCGEKAMRWYKLKTVFYMPVNCSVKISFYSSETRTVNINGRDYDMGELIRSPLEPALKQLALKPFIRFSGKLEKELLLTEIRGRYLFFLIQCVCPDGQPLRVSVMKLYFAPYMWINYLPEIYRTEENGFLERYLAIFQSIFEDMEEKIERSAECYSPENPSYDFLKWLCGWCGIADPDLWSAEQLRYILKNAARIYGGIGTRDIIAELCELYLGRGVRIVEFYMKDSGDFVNNLGIPDDRIFVNPYVFTVIIEARSLSAAEYEGLLRVIDVCKPAHMGSNIILLPGNEKEENYLEEESVLTEKGIALV